MATLRREPRFSLPYPSPDELTGRATSLLIRSKIRDVRDHRSDLHVASTAGTPVQADPGSSRSVVSKSVSKLLARSKPVCRGLMSGRGWASSCQDWIRDDHPLHPLDVLRRARVS